MIEQIIDQLATIADPDVCLSGKNAAAYFITNNFRALLKEIDQLKTENEMLKKPVSDKDLPKPVYRLDIKTGKCYPGYYLIEPTVRRKHD